MAFRNVIRSKFHAQISNDFMLYENLVVDIN